MESPNAEARPFLSWDFYSLSPKSISEDWLHGAADIAHFLFGKRDERCRRRVYYLIETCQLPVIRLGGLCARRSTLLAWVREQELASIESAKGALN